MVTLPCRTSINPNKINPGLGHEIAQVALSVTHANEVVAQAVNHLWDTHFPEFDKTAKIIIDSKAVVPEMREGISKVIGVHHARDSQYKSMIGKIKRGIQTHDLECSTKKYSVIYDAVLCAACAAGPIIPREIVEFGQEILLFDGYNNPERAFQYIDDFTSRYLLAPWRLQFDKNDPLPLLICETFPLPQIELENVRVELIVTEEIQTLSIGVTRLTLGFPTMPFIRG